MAPVAAVPIAVALGSNLGARKNALSAAVDGLAEAVEVDAVSSVYASAPVGYEDQPDFLNAVLIGRTRLLPEVLLVRGHALESAAGRERPFVGAPRPLDVDLVFYDARIVRGAGLVLPHPRFRDRAFVLAPLAEIAPTWVDPVTGRTVEEIWNERRDDLPEVRKAAPPETLWRPPS